ncbi:potassium channel family protein [Sodalinema gerasimenkoae]|uniref:potassium channel family protein n=1 Tax=Sodalinema gerasimenkoae TaxID=2862348 RepID=UPI001356C5C4|nr:potassium channel family protein [Sodalinema gerasimenkoae]
MHRAFRQMLLGGVVFVCTIAFAVMGYVLLGWEWIDAIYMVIITIFGVGYSEVNPLESTTEKVFTIIVIIAGTSSAVYIVGGFNEAHPTCLGRGGGIGANLRLYY